MKYNGSYLFALFGKGLHIDLAGSYWEESIRADFLKLRACLGALRTVLMLCWVFVSGLAIDLERIVKYGNE